MLNASHIRETQQHDGTTFSDWSGSITPPMSDAEDGEILESQCVLPLKKSSSPYMSAVHEEGIFTLSVLNILYSYIILAVSDTYFSVRI